MNSIIVGDCLNVLPKVQTSSVDLIMTSPPYADKRSYETTSVAKYVDWFLPRAEQFHRVLKLTGSFVLNIKAGVSNGERQTYVLELVLKLREHGWLWTEEYVWHKKNSFPGKWPNRFRDAWESCYHFTKEKKFYMDQDSVMVPMGDWAVSRLKSLSDKDKRRDPSAVGSGFGKNIGNWVGRDKAYPTNVIHLATECGNKEHPAAFPLELPTWFIKLFTKPNDLVLDPFSGAGTTCVAAKQLGRNYMGIDISTDYCEKARTRLSKTSRSLEDRIDEL